MSRHPRIDRTPDGRRLVVDRLVAADPGDVWTVLTDTHRWPEWGPSVSAVRSSERFIETGTTGEVQVAGGPWLPFEVDTCVEYRWTWSVVGLPATGHFVEPLGERCRVGFEIPLYAAAYAVVCRRALERIARLTGG